LRAVIITHNLQAQTTQACLTQPCYCCSKSADQLRSATPILFHFQRSLLLIVQIVLLRNQSMCVYLQSREYSP
jgi:hypothetical protein